MVFSKNLNSAVVVCGSRQGRTSLTMLLFLSRTLTEPPLNYRGITITTKDRKSVV